MAKTKETQPVEVQVTEQNVREETRHQEIKVVLNSILEVLRKIENNTFKGF